MPYVVFFEETSEERVVTHVCRRCLERSDFPFTVREAPVVGPRGVAHNLQWKNDERTLCGRNATGEKWWWRY